MERQTNVIAHKRTTKNGTVDVVHHLRSVGLKNVSSSKIFGQVIISGRRWFEKRNGNTYHSVTVYVDNQVVGREPFTYGYGDGYIQTGFELLQKAGYFKGKSYMDFIYFKRDSNGRVITVVSDVARKKDLTGGW